MTCVVDSDHLRGLVRLFEHHPVAWLQADVLTVHLAAHGGLEPLQRPRQKVVEVDERLQLRLGELSKRFWGGRRVVGGGVDLFDDFVRRSDDGRFGPRRGQAIRHFAPASGERKRTSCEDERRFAEGLEATSGFRKRGCSPPLHPIADDSGDVDGFVENGDELGGDRDGRRHACNVAWGPDTRGHGA